MADRGDKFALDPRGTFFGGDVVDLNDVNFHGLRRVKRPRHLHQPPTLFAVGAANQMLAPIGFMGIPPQSGDLLHEAVTLGGRQHQA